MSNLNDTPKCPPTASPETHYPPGTPRRLKYGDESVLDFLAHARATAPHLPAYEFMGRMVTFSEADTLSERMARYLHGRGVAKQDRVLICLPNIPQCPIAILAVLKLGAVCVMANPLNTADELAAQILDSGCRVAFVLDLHVEKLKTAGLWERLDTVIFTHLNDFLPLPSRWLYPWLRRKMYRRIRPHGALAGFLPALKARPSEERVRPRPVQDDLALLIYTGGTTGSPKGVRLTHSNISRNARQVTEWLSAFGSGEERVLGVFPFFTGAGFTALMAGALAKTAMVALIPRPTPLEVMKTARRVKATLLPAVPTIYAGLLAAPAFRARAKNAFSHLKISLSGAAPLPPEIKMAWEEITGVPLVELYGMSETTAMTHGNPMHRTKPGSAGLPISDTDCRIVDFETGETELPQGVSGEICVRGPQIMEGYFRNSEESRMVLRQGWLHTGDIGYEDAEGYLFIVGRKKEMIISGGYNVYPKEVEAVLQRHPHIEEAAAIGVPDAYRGQSIKVFLKLKPGARTDEPGWDAHCRKSLAAYKVPRIYQVIDAFPKNALGKTVKSKLA
jgi:long-chain acyl-CoA synthetase